MVGKPFGHEMRSHQIAVETEPEQGPLANGDIAVLRTLSAADEHGASGIVDVPTGKFDELVSPYAARIEDLENRTIPQPQRLRYDRSAEDCSHLDRTQSGLWESAVGSGHRHVSRRVDVNPSAATQP
jgi:hypothetical protein